MSSVILSAEQYFSYQKRKIIRIEDYEAIKDGCDDCSEVGASLFKNTNVVYNGHSSNNTGVRGYTASMMSLNNIDIALGRGFTPADEEHAFHNAIVGYDIVDNLIGDGDPLGKEIRVDGIPFTIIGVGDRQGKTLGQSQDNWVAVPISTYQQIYGYNDSVDIYARATGGSDNGCAPRTRLASSCVRGATNARRSRTTSKSRPTTPSSTSRTRSLGVFAWVVLGLGSIALVVGGVVIMNIMLVSVSERTREIGVRKALGAKQRDVLMQFLIESASLASVGGAFGVLLRRGGGQTDHHNCRLPDRSTHLGRLSRAVSRQQRRHFLRRLPGQQSGKTGSGSGPKSRDVRDSSPFQSYLARSNL